MSLKEKLQQDWKDALKGKDKFKANVISMAKAAILQIEKTNAVKLNDEEVIEVLAKEVKSRRDALLEFKRGKRQDLVDTANAEIEILMSYLPQQLTEDELKDIIKSAASEVGANSIKDMGKVMAAIIPKTKGRADNSMISSLVKEYLK